MFFRPPVELVFGCEAYLCVRLFHRITTAFNSRGAVAPSAGNFLIAVNFVIRALDNHRNSNFECIANPQKSRHRNRTTSFDLLPVASGESKSNHILLAVAASLAEVLDSLAKGFEESGVVYHAASFTFA